MEAVDAEDAAVEVVAVDVAGDKYNFTYEPWSIVRGFCGVPPAQIPWTVINLG